jgi:hypothetical protein
MDNLNRAAYSICRHRWYRIDSLFTTDYSFPEYIQMFSYRMIDLKRFGTIPEQTS